MVSGRLPDWFLVGWLVGVWSITGCWFLLGWLIGFWLVGWMVSGCLLVGWLAGWLVGIWEAVRAAFQKSSFIAARPPEFCQPGKDPGGGRLTTEDFL